MELNRALKSPDIHKTLKHMATSTIWRFVNLDNNEWLLFNTKWAIISYNHGENKIHFNEIMIISTSYYTSTLSWIFTVLAHWNNSLWVHMLTHSFTLSWFQTSRSLLLLFNAVCLAMETANTNFLVFGVTWPEFGYIFNRFFLQDIRKGWL